MKYAALAAVALLVAGCGNPDPWIDLQTAQAQQDCSKAGVTPDSSTYKSCVKAGVKKLQDYR